MKSRKSLVLVSVLVAFHVSCFCFANLEAMRARVPKIVKMKDGGMICEKRDGLLKAVKSSADVNALVKAENRDRMKVYKKRAKKGKHKLDTFMKVMGEERIKKAKPGHFIESASGMCVKKG